MKPGLWVRTVLRGARARDKGAFDAAALDQTPLRAELYSVDQMEQHGRWLAGTHQISKSASHDRLLKRLDDNQTSLIESCSVLTAAVKARLPIVPAGEWLLDNFHLIDEQIRTARRHLPKNYSRELPRLAEGSAAGLPRVYDLVLEVISHGDGRVDAEMLRRFVAAYQTVTSLTLGELWAIPIMLRLALIENLRRVGAGLAAARAHVNLAQDWATRMIDIAADDPKSLILVIADMARSRPPMSGAFVAELARRLQGQGPALALPLTWIEQRLAESSLTTEVMVLAENQQQASDQVSISNSIGSLRFLGAMDWREFVETMSAVEQLFKLDPTGIYGAMDFATRDQYRQVVDRLAKRSVKSEIEVASAAVELARLGAASGQSHLAHLGYYLIDAGLDELEAAVQVRLPLLARLRFARRPRFLYLTAMLLLSFLLAGMFLLFARADGLSNWALLWVAAPSLLVASQLATALCNWLATLSVSPKRLPRMDYALGLPADMRTLVVVPSLIGSAADVDDLLEGLEVRFLGNRDAHLHFALLTDYNDAASEVLLSDAVLLQRAQYGIEALNAKYQEADGSRFLLFHRPRRWNPSEGVWMGEERKRGKLADLNALLRGHGAQRFARVVGDLDALGPFRYIITLDTDTQLPRETARQLVGAMAHPLNRPRFDAARRRVCGGYGILQPRMAATLSGANRSRYAQLCGSEPGIDPYTRSVSDVYQDVFGEGSFIGKGIYDIDAFEWSLGGRLPENRILSHDLLEGCHARSGLISDVQLYEDYPTRYEADVSRQVRWIRGDWQIAQWLLPRVPGADAKRLDNPLTPLSRGKVLDNLRRSVLPAALLLLLLSGWALAQAPLLWTLAVLSVIALPPVLIAMVDVCRKPMDVALMAHARSVLQALRHSFAVALFRLACLPYEAYVNVDAIVRTLWRMYISRRLLLEWRVSSASARRPQLRMRDSYRSMWFAPTLVIAVLAVGALRPGAWLAAAPLLGLWLAAPALAYWLSLPLRRTQITLAAEQSLFLQRIARKTWAFFDQFMVAEDHWLPPDNYQLLPGPVTAHRTSPTNMGLGLLANLAAHDFAYISAASLLTRCAQTLISMARLERHQGHFYNWYDTHSLQPLPPRYISSVDSGNLAGHLVTLRIGLLALPYQPISSPRLFAGLSDALAVAEHTWGDTSATLLRMRRQLDTLRNQSPNTLRTQVRGLQALAELAADMVAAQGGDADQQYWIDAVWRQCLDLSEDLVFLAPWLSHPAGHGADAPAFDELVQQGLQLELGAIPTLRALAGLRVTLAPLIAVEDQSSSSSAADWRQDLPALLALGRQRARQRIATTSQVAMQANDFAQMSYAFLYDSARHLLAVGYNVDHFRRDTSYYDLLASEARLTCFVAIAQGQLPQESWFALGRLLTSAGGEPILVSWSGSMFEYLMPMLVMPSYAGTLLDQTCQAAVAQQIAYGNQRGLPWGVSESGYYTFDASLNYQYHAFGVPGLGLKRGLAEDSVVAPYASALALMVAPEAACSNLQRLSEAGLEGRFGFFEAIDFTPSRLQRNQSSVIVRSYMAHHQGMSLLSLAHLLLDRPMQRRFEADLQVQSAILLLQERIPKNAVISVRSTVDSDGSAFFDAPTPSVQAPMGAQTANPEVHLLSNGRYHVMLSNSGGGYSRWKDLAVTRWREDSTCDNWGNFVYLRDVASGEVWSAAEQPVGRRAEHYEAMFAEGRAEYRRLDVEIETYTEVVVSPEDDIEVRRVRVTNRSRSARTIEITSYAEVVLAQPAADLTQTSFGNLFVQTKIHPARRAIACTRRPRSIGEATPWMFHLLAPNGSPIESISYETDRMRFIGRGRSVAAPLALAHLGPLSNTDGSVLDPIIAIRCQLTLKPEQSASLDFVTGAAVSHELCMALVDKYQDRHLTDRAFDIAPTHAGVLLRQINVSEADAQSFRRLAGRVIYAHASLRAESQVLLQNRRGQSGLWGYAISGDLPIVLLKISDAANLDLARLVIQCHGYWRLKGLSVDLVIWNEDHIGYRQRLQDQILALIATGIESHAIDRPGGIFVRYAEQIPSEDRILLQAVARVILSDTQGGLTEQIDRAQPPEKRVPLLTPSRRHRPEPAAAAEPARSDLQQANALGGFSADGREYVITTVAAQLTPLPWSNVLANARFGTVITESGPGYTFHDNAHEFRLTPWSDDPVGASSGEAFFLRDEETGYYWSPTPLPCRGAMPYVSRHGFGYSVFEHSCGGIRSELWVFVDLNESVKYSVLKIRNGSGRNRRLSATGYVEWVLGDLRSKTAMHVVTAVDRSSGALIAHNAYNNEFAGCVAFFDVDDLSRSLTGDRAEFIGRNGKLSAPAAMRRVRLSGQVGAGFDPCAAIQVPFELADGQEREIVFRLGAGDDLDSVQELALRSRTPGTARSALNQVHKYWQHTLSTLVVETPDPALNLLSNGWLVYQVLACRLWARSGYYQSGGAFGFRDQLQDVMALVHAQPQLVRAHLLRCAQRQYPQGDVQHWWHPPSGRGVRTRCSDDYLWLPLACCRYVQITSDFAVFDETTHFLEGRALGVGEESYYDLPGRADESATLYQHCVRAIEHGLRFGERGLPLMGSGDWNDGMNLVGIHGQGESVWLGFFLHEVLSQFGEIARLRGDALVQQRCQQQAQLLRQNLDAHGWDGAWYRRAYFDDGTPLGSASNTECRIDSIAQSWSVLSGVAAPDQARQAMDSLDQHLVRRATGVIQLLDPPFDTSALNPGYIKGYVPGVRENGGQYTHAAIWAAMAFAKLGDNKRAWELLQLINPINHGRGSAIDTYKAEPYVVAADVYAVAPHIGRGGWTWYTGSAGWLYRLITESLLGLRVEGTQLKIEACLPDHWTHYTLSYRYLQTVYQIKVTQTWSDQHHTMMTLDKVEQTSDSITLINDRRAHTVQVNLQRARPVDSTV